MELSFYIRLQTPPKGVNHARAIKGATAARNWDRLTAVARELGVTPLQDFVCVGKEEAALLSEKRVAAGLLAQVSKDKWYPPAAALATIRKLISRVSVDKKSFENPRLLIKELQCYENILSSAESRGSKFHFSPDVEVTPEK